MSPFGTFLSFSDNFFWLLYRLELQITLLKNTQRNLRINLNNHFITISVL